VLRFFVPFLLKIRLFDLIVKNQRCLPVADGVISSSIPSSDSFGKFDRDMEMMGAIGLNGVVGRKHSSRQGRRESGKKDNNNGDDDVRQSKQQQGVEVVKQRSSSSLLHVISKMLCIPHTAIPQHEVLDFLQFQDEVFTGFFSYWLFSYSSLRTAGSI
jgi:hypothetical protein